jgi:hypothetical protein
VRDAVDQELDQRDEECQRILLRFYTLTVEAGMSRWHVMDVIRCLQEPSERQQERALSLAQNACLDVSKATLLQEKNVSLCLQLFLAYIMYTE